MYCKQERRIPLQPLHGRRPAPHRDRLQFLLPPSYVGLNTLNAVITSWCLNGQNRNQHDMHYCVIKQLETWNQMLFGSPGFFWPSRIFDSHMANLQFRNDKQARPWGMYLKLCIPADLILSWSCIATCQNILYNVMLPGITTWKWDCEYCF